MKTQLSRALSVVLAVVLLGPSVPAWATCGGGGGGGMGGADEPAYQVPWKVMKPSDPPVNDGLILYWFPTGQQELERSSLRNSRTLTMYSSQCVAMTVAEATAAVGQKLVGNSKLPVAVLAEPDLTVVGRAENVNGYLRVEAVEKLLEEEMKKRESAVKERLEEGKNKAKSGDKQAAMTPEQRLRSAKELRDRVYPPDSKDIRAWHRKQ